MTFPCINNAFFWRVKFQAGLFLHLKIASDVFTVLRYMSQKYFLSGKENHLIVFI